MAATLKPDPVSWTADAVADRLVEAFRLLPGHPVYSAHGRLRLTGDGIADGARDVLGWPLRFVPAARQRLVLMTWARCTAEGSSVRARFRELGWSRTTAERGRREALEAIAAGLNAALRMDA